MPDSKLKVYPVLLAGGSGTRLWPVSRELYPKQLVKFIGQDSLVQATIKRLTPVVDTENIRIVCGKEHYHEIARHMADAGTGAAGKIISEPCGRNTAPAILLALLNILKLESDAILCVFPADHVIKDIEIFHKNLKAAIALASNGYIVTFGIKPSYPETGYGYIEGAEPLPEGAFALKRFVEKPDRETAQKYLEAGTFFWNAGMFAFQASVMQNEFKTHAPELYEKLARLVSTTEELTVQDYSKLDDISIDYAIMEFTEKGAVLPSEFGWSDIGSWKSLYDFLPKDEYKNVVDGDVIFQDTHNCFLMGRDRLLAANGLENLVVVETPDSVFVSDMENSREVKSIVTKLKERGRREYQHHPTVHYSWGELTILEKKDDFWIDRIVIYPGQAFDSDLEDRYCCNLVSVKGEIAVKWDGQTKHVNKGESLMIGNDPITLINSNDRPATLIRVICGKLLA